MGRLQGKVAIVTGGARGMGGATSKLFVQEGARVIIADVLENEGRALADELGSNARFEKLDVSDEANWKAVAESAVKHFDTVDVLINNAAIIAFGELTQLPLAEFQRVININLIGAFLGIQNIAPIMKEKKSGSIVNISSVDGLRGANGLGAYSSSKWALRGLTRVAALELGHHGVRVNSIHPGGVNTSMGNPAAMPAELMNKAYTRVPMQRVGEPHEIANASLFLASDEASYVCGAELSVDGGWAAGSYHESLPGRPLSERL